jgi:hypothetical protein
MSHTTGPWTLWTQTDADISEPSAHIALVSHIFVVGSGELASPHADARLIAAAPEMLEALKDAEKHCGVIPLETLRAIIAKTEGSND